MKKAKNKSKSKLNKTFAVSQILSLIIEIFAFSFILGGMAVFSSEEVKALDTGTIIPVGCCVNAGGGGICQEMSIGEAQACKSGLIPTNCNQVDDCQTGCCYSKEEGICAYNSPKKKCLENNGNWSASSLCQIPECTLGCCVLDDEASTTTTRECTIKARDLGLEKNFQPLDSDGTCNSKTRLKRMGACVFDSPDYSGEKDCSFISKGICQTKGGAFYEDYLCTSKELDTTCFKSKNTTCIDGSDKIYYVDTCGNRANVYDSSKYDEEDYWEQVVAPASLCTASPGDGDCGNCDYMAGSLCSSYRKDKDEKPEMGNNVCRDLNCANGKKHGESWCISDYDTQEKAKSPIGSRQFKATCMYGEVAIEPCADFNQEICEQGNSGTYTEARCIANQWRSCMAANDYDNYEDIKLACEGYSQCVMINDTINNPSINLFPGFSSLTTKQDDPYTLGNWDKSYVNPYGKVGNIGENMNGKIQYCLPKYTPGMVFWTTGDTNNSYGGSYIETKAICSLGNFNCVTKHEKNGAASQAEYYWDNSICYGENSKTPEFIDALNERCRMLGPCGIQANIAGELGKINVTNSMFSRINIDENGNIGESYTPTNINFSRNYIAGLKSRTGIIHAPGSLASLTNAISLVLVTGKVVESGATRTQATEVASQASAGAPQEPMSWYAALGTLIATGLGIGQYSDMIGVTTWRQFNNIFTTTNGAGWGWGQTIGYALIAAAAGYLVGQMTAKWFGFDSNAEAQTFSEALALGLASGVLASKFTFNILNIRQLNWGRTGTWVGVIVAIAVSYLYYINNVQKIEHYVTHYECMPWQPPTEGNCELCNNDIRPCTEYRCKSLGQNCHYFNSNGEPGWCTENDEIWSATISPWQQALTEGMRYSDVGDLRFTITTSNGAKVPAWTGIEFGVETSKQAQCKIDNKHTAKFEDMAFSMIIDPTIACEAGNCINQGLFHRIGLSPYMSQDSDTSSTLKLMQGENQFFIRCRNFAGQSNNPEFVVKINVGEGPDRTPPIISSFNPESNSYVKLGETQKRISFLVSEPSECKYSQGVNLRFEDMTNKASCMQGDFASVLGKWPCYATLGNLTAGDNKFYFQCKDQPGLLEEQASMRNINRNSKEYNVKTCDKGLNITNLSPKELIVTGKSPISVDLEAETSGCIDGGKATCSYKFAGGYNIPFLKTGGLHHIQNFTNMPNGTSKITVICEDEAGNSDTKTLDVVVDLDNKVPSVIKAYTLGTQLIIQTDENSQCKFTTNSSLGCSFDYDSDALSLMNGETKYHTIAFKENSDYYVKCSDIYGNVNSDCGVIVKTYRTENEE